MQAPPGIDYNALRDTTDAEGPDFDHTAIPPPEATKGKKSDKHP